MKLLIVILLSAACTTSSQQVPGSVKFLEQDAKVRRQGVSYSTSIIHDNPKHPDQRAESSINVNFNPQKVKQIRQSPSQPNLSYQSFNNNLQQKRPKALQIYGSNNIQLLQQHHQQPQQYSVEEKIPQANELRSNIQTIPFSGPQTQSFNVGYSVSFTGGQKPQPHSPRAFSMQKLENAEIITGSRKDVVRKPNTEFDSNDFVNNALIDLKKQKVSGIKPKFHKFSPNKENDAKNFIGNLAPKTQQYLSYLGDAKPIGSSNPRFRQQLQGDDAQSTQTVGSSWTNLSPSVEIYHSKELPQNHNFSPKEQLEQSKQFDHAAALGKSQGFDYTNALNGEIEKNQSNNVQPFQEVPGNTLGQPETQQQNVFQGFPDLEVNVEGNPLIVPFTNSFDSLPLSVTVPLDNLQISHKSSDLQGLPNPLSLLQTPGGGIPPKLPVDVSLLRNAVLAPNGKNVPNGLHTITIPFDTTVLQAMQQKLLTSTQPIQSFDANKGQVQLLQGNVGIAGQQFQGQAENLQVQPLPGLKQNTFQDQGFQDYQGQQIQQTQQYNVYETPQHALFLKKGFDKYFDQYFDRMEPQESKYESVTMRYPKVNNISNNRLRSTKGMPIHTNLQPPPIRFTRHRRMFIG